jgi:hypothetical protein
MTLFLLHMYDKIRIKGNKVVNEGEKKKNDKFIQGSFPLVKMK